VDFLTFYMCGINRNAIGKAAYHIFVVICFGILYANASRYNLYI
jgi:hypothetical protein